MHLRTLMLIEQRYGSSPNVDLWLVWRAGERGPFSGIMHGAMPLEEAERVRSLLALPTEIRTSEIAPPTLKRSKATLQRSLFDDLELLAQAKKEEAINALPTTKQPQR